MENTQTERVANVKPFGHRIAVVDPPAQEQRSSGLYLPGGTDDVAVGIVVSNPATEDAYQAFMSEMAGGQELRNLKPGCLVYYHKGHGVEIRGVRVFPAECILAYEEA